MSEYRVENVKNHIKVRNAEVGVPGSKSITNRALLLAALSDGDCELRGALFSDDSRHFLRCIQELGIQAVADEASRLVKVRGCGRVLPKKEASVYVGSAGTAARFITALLGLNEGRYFLDASEQMRKRPMAPLLDTLRSIGCTVECLENADSFPFSIGAGGSQDSSKLCVTVDIDKSSQFLSALLICAVCKDGGMRINVSGKHGMSYIRLTISMMEQFGVNVEAAPGVYIVPEGSRYRREVYEIEPDMSAAAYFYAAAAVLGISVTVRGVRKGMLQGDAAFLDVLKNMGCTVTDEPEGVCVTGTVGKLRGVEADMHEFSDQAITLAAIAPYASSPTHITGIGHIRFQESDRIAAICKNLRAMGIRVDEYEDSLTVYPGQPRPALIETFDDHRLAMGFSLTGLCADGIRIKNPGCCAKTFEDYFQVFDRFLAGITGK